MKHLPHYLAVLLIISTTFSNTYADNDNALVTGDEYLFQVQSDIEIVLNESHSVEGANTVDSLKIIIEKLHNINATTSGNIAYYKDYWLAYSYYNLAIELLRINATEKIEKSERQAPVISAMKILKMMPMDTEVSALYSIVAGLNYEYLPFSKIFAATRDINKALKVSLKSKPENVRALYANAVSDFYTPAQYGGGKKTHGFLIRAVKKDKVESGSPLEPSWGHQESFDLLIQYYLKKNDKEKAREVFQDLLKLYPNTRYKSAWAGLLEE